MTHVQGDQATMALIPEILPAWALARRLAAAGLEAQVSRRWDGCELTIVGVATGKISKKIVQPCPIYRTTREGWGKLPLPP